MLGTALCAPSNGGAACGRNPRKRPDTAGRGPPPPPLRPRPPHGIAKCGAHAAQCFGACQLCRAAGHSVRIGGVDWPSVMHYDAARYVNRRACIRRRASFGRCTMSDASARSTACGCATLRFVQRRQCATVCVPLRYVGLRHGAIREAV